MTQKRFRKLLMSKGYERNAINKIVKKTIDSGKPYAEVYKVITAFEKININIKFCSEAFKNAIKKIAAACAMSNEIVAHHIKPVTMQNVNDNSISHNPENIMFVTPQEHNEIHRHIFRRNERGGRV